jgi:hypothetical protein
VSGVIYGHKNRVISVKKECSFLPEGNLRSMEKEGAETKVCRKQHTAANKPDPGECACPWGREKRAFF